MKDKDLLREGLEKIKKQQEQQRADAEREAEAKRKPGRPKKKG